MDESFEQEIYNFSSAFLKPLSLWVLNCCSDKTSEQYLYFSQHCFLSYRRVSVVSWRIFQWFKDLWLHRFNFILEIIVKQPVGRRFLFFITFAVWIKFSTCSSKCADVLSQVISQCILPFYLILFRAAHSQKLVCLKLLGFRLLLFLLLQFLTRPPQEKPPAGFRMWEWTLRFRRKFL